jgi:hypothetical protein
MPLPSKAGRTWVRAGFSFILSALRMLFILLLVVLPVPGAALLVAALDPVRRNLPAEVLRKKEGEP